MTDPAGSWLPSTVPDVPLTLPALFEHGRRVHAGSVAVSAGPDAGGEMRLTFAEVADRAERLAGGLARLGVQPGDRVATFCANHIPHLELYLAVPCMGAVLHTVNMRLFVEDLAYIVGHARDKVIVVDEELGALVAGLLPDAATVEHVVVVGDPAAAGLPDAVAYEELVATGEPATWPEVPESAAAGLCYTSGTTGRPKGVAYSHRATVLHSFASCMTGVLGLGERDVVLPVVPMFHANGWGLPYSAWLSGADLLLPGAGLTPARLCGLVEEHRATFAAAVPTVWNDVLDHARSADPDLGSLRMIMCGGAAVPRGLIEAFRERFGVTITQGWGMTETGPVAAIGHPPKGGEDLDELSWRAKTGRIIPGVQLRVADDAGTVLPWDGESVGELEVRGPWVTAGYYEDPAPDKFRDGWLRTGDVGTIDPKGFVQITDRAKDVIKSGGEWISSVELENHLMAHPDVVEAAVIAVDDPRWQERPLACVVAREGADLDVDALRAHLQDKVARWWIPERWSLVEAIPRTGVGKFDKKRLRDRLTKGELAIETSSTPPPKKEDA
jgi:fatty-acyl-CoA synthase